jgi:acetylornithine deacetylase
MGSKQDIIKLLSELIALPSVNPGHDVQRTRSPYGEGRVADYVESYFRPFGVGVQRQEIFPGRPNVIVRIPGEDRFAKPIVLEAHMDTVNVEGMADPFTPRVADGRVYGRGACDTKASLAAMMMAVKQLLEEGVSLPRSCLLLATVDEEFGTVGIQRWADLGTEVSAAVVGEPTSLRVISAHNGQIWFKIFTHGKAAHSSRPYLGVNAIYIMTEVIQVLQRRVASVYARRCHPLCGPPTLSVGKIQGGVLESVVPEACEISIDRRVIPGETQQGAIEEIKGWIAEDLDAETTKTVELGPVYYDLPPLETPTAHPLVQGLRAAVVNTLGDAEVAGAPYGTDAGYLGAKGIPVVVFGPGDGAQAHTVEESVDVVQVEKAVEILKRFLLAGTKSLD